MSGPSPTEVVDAINAVSGAHEGFRAAHAKGTLMGAAFTPTPEASSLSRAAHLAGGPVRATVRFSNGGGDPGIPDYAREARGVAIKLYLDDGRRTDMVGLTLPCFFVRTVEDFHAFTKARAEGMEAAG
ncbi:MAG: catalase, partial [Actinomycetota bacterium]|nr:catalase [Actinomycetota bacterium]